MLVAISNKDFNRKPSLNAHDECFFIDMKNGIILNQYDDRGLEVVSTSKDTLLPLYQNHYNWILKYDLKRIDETFLL